MLILSASYLCLVLCQVIFTAYHQLQCNNTDYLMCIMWDVTYCNIVFQKWILINFSFLIFLCSYISFFVIFQEDPIQWLPVESRKETIYYIIQTSTHGDIWQVYCVIWLRIWNAKQCCLITWMVRKNRSWALELLKLLIEML